VVVVVILLFHLLVALALQPKGITVAQVILAPLTSVTVVVAVVPALLALQHQAIMLVLVVPVCRHLSPVPVFFGPAVVAVVRVAWVLVVLAVMVVAVPVVPTV
jgi:hypothetical protein